ncbi:cell division control protein 14 [Linnemannia zychae]|nr:cell division control protein 14 [Linnemannia zychae]
MTIDNYLQYTAFFSDFGPFDIADVFRFCCLMKERLELAKSQGKVLCLHTKPDDIKRANAAFALCCYMMLSHDMTPEEAYAPLEYIHPTIASYRDSGCGPVTYTLSILDCLRGLRKGLDRGLLRLDKFNVKEYEYYERVSNGDFNWITPFFIAFAGPKDKLKRATLLKYEATRAGEGISGSDISAGISSQSEPESLEELDQTQENSRMMCPSSISAEVTPADSKQILQPRKRHHPMATNNTSDDSEICTTPKIKTKKTRTKLHKSFRSVLNYFSVHNVQCIIRLNEKTYDKTHFTALGIEHIDLIYPDGTCPPWHIVEQFFEVCERVAIDQGGVIAVHCMAGLGRTGTLIGAYLMRHFDMSARDTIAFLRLMRPGSVVGPQQNWLEENEWRIRRRDNQFQ